ncbi:GNAT family N-acetyltransferase [Gulosibacter macacae]|uniref:GNAT family N-acetyltransferase n=1 Tax=Gulosibacter macacae TaxID=2488791 RepID=A0A3P3VX07_9MICO|nr:GNAT family N-acetyltransferase [Gulosibacter macacae]RRJ86578.1 GNAT family N-acetyltransferase [Gulosibacter macacae]
MPVIREATSADAPALLECIQLLAEYEREPDVVVNTIDRIRELFFGPNPAVFAHVAKDAGEVVGIAIWYLTYSTWEGEHGIHLEDLYVKDAHRGRGHALALMRQLAAICTERGYARFEWAVLDWNQLAIDFYERLGAEPMTGWHIRRLEGEALAALAAQHPVANG